MSRSPYKANYWLFGEKSKFVKISNYIYIDHIFVSIGEKKINIFTETVFVAMKNGEHDGRGYLFASGEILEKFDNTENIKITEIKNKIKSFFIKSSE